MYRAAVIGGSESVKGFAALGVKTFETDEAAAALRTVAALAEQEYAVIYITEALYSAIEDRLSRYRDRLVPAIIPIPGVSGNTGVGMANVSRSVEQAVGSDILN